MSIQKWLKKIGKKFTVWTNIELCTNIESETNFFIERLGNGRDGNYNGKPVFTQTWRLKSTWKENIEIILKDFQSQEKSIPIIPTFPHSVFYSKNLLCE